MKRLGPLLISILGGILGGMIIAGSADAARNASGTMSLVTGNPVVTGTSISSTVFNNTMTDFKTEMTDSLSRSGKGAMLAALQLTNGTLGAPSLTFATDSDTGLYRVGANDVALVAGGVKVIEGTATTATVPLATTFSSTTAHTGAATFGALTASSTMSSTNLLQATGGGIQIGSSGTAITKSVAADITWDPDPAVANTCQTLTAQTITGAATNGVCTVSFDTNMQPLVPFCWVSAANAVDIMLCNVGATTPNFTSRHVYVRVWNP